MTVLFLMNLGFAGGTASVAPSVFGDLTTLLHAHLGTIYTGADLTTTLTTNLATVRNGEPDYTDDLNTALAASITTNG